METHQKQLSRRTVETEHLTDYRDLVINRTINTLTNFVKFKITDYLCTMNLKLKTIKPETDLKKTNKRFIPLN